ncbi:MAG: glycine--tRNA ligase subunit beta [Candidatus Eiseniibacteriota bacterium]
MTRHDLVCEIGTEEVPAGYLPPAVEQLRSEAQAFFAASRLEPAALETHATPRRLVLLARGVPERQEDRTEVVTGPPWKAAFGPDGRATKAAEGFARGKGLSVENLRPIETERGPYAGATVQVEGRPAVDLLAEALPGILAKLAFPKTMRWGTERFRFPRPIRWILALLGDRVIPFAIEGVSSDRITHGHRVLARGPFPVASAADYPAALGRGRVILVAAERAARIEAALVEAAAKVGGTLVPDPGLVEEVSFLVETPSVIAGTFDREFLELPAPVITTAMRSHQRYFAVVGAGGKLLPNFLAVSNGAPEAAPRVTDGNQRVLRARLDDARFYWNEDLRTTLEAKVPSLQRVVWLEGFGSLGDKSARVAKLAAFLAERLPAETRAAVQRASLLAKADLVCAMIRDGKEFTALQGVMGREYALRQGEPEEVAAALEEQYRPRFAGDALPATEAGACLALADRLDTMIGVWAAGQKPTGSKDPFALRRGALGIIRILADRRRDVSVRSLLARAAEGYGVVVPEPVVGECADFVRDRLAGWLVDEAGIAADVVAAVLAAADPNPLDALARARALAELRDARREDFEALAAGFKRARNILKKDSAEGAPEAALLSERAERALFDAWIAVESAVAEAEREHRYADAFAGLASLRAPIDGFFDHVLVLAEDPRVRVNRLRLLGRIVDRVQGLADLSRLAVPEEQRV